MALINYLLTILNFLSLLLSIPILAAGAWLAVRHTTDCLRYLQSPLIVIGLFIFFVSLLGLIGSCRRVVALLWLYLAVMMLLIIVLFAVTVFALAVTSTGSGDSVSGRNYQEYHLDKYSKWLQNEVSKAGNWNKIKACIQDAQVCQNLDIYTDSHSFYNATLSPLQSGCCKPPTDCNLTFVNATDWNPPSTGLNTSSTSDEADCKAWSNDQAQLCYDCDSCRAGVIENLRVDWRKAAILNVIVLTFLVVVYALGWCAFNKARRQARLQRIEQGLYLMEHGHSKGLPRAKPHKLKSTSPKGF